MKRVERISLLAVCCIVLMATTSGKPAWQMKADYVEACSCHLFCPCYFNKHAEHPHCEFNMAVKVREGHSGDTNLAGAKYWLTGDLGESWGTEKKGKLRGRAKNAAHEPASRRSEVCASGGTS